MLFYSDISNILCMWSAIETAHCNWIGLLSI